MWSAGQYWSGPGLPRLTVSYGLVWSRKNMARDAMALTYPACYFLSNYGVPAQCQLYVTLIIVSFKPNVFGSKMWTSTVKIEQAACLHYSVIKSTRALLLATLTKPAGLLAAKPFAAFVAKNENTRPPESKCKHLLWYLRPHTTNTYLTVRPKYLTVIRRVEFDR